MSPSLENILSGLITEDECKQPRQGEVWVRRQKDTEADELRAILAKKYQLPDRVQVLEVHNGWGGRRILLTNPDETQSREPFEVPCFESLYELHRPSAWERLTGA
jgi:hypothetical protein